MSTQKSTREIEQELQRKKAVEQKKQEIKKRDEVAAKIASERKQIHHCLTRRDFISQGLALGSGAVMTSGFTSLLMSGASEAALLEQYLPKAITAGFPSLVVDLAGGANLLGGNVIVGSSSSENQMDVGNKSGSYLVYGIPADLHPKNPANTEDKYGLKFHTSSGILAGLNDGIGHDPNDPDSPPDLSKNIDGIFACAITGDDTANNPINAIMNFCMVAGDRGDLAKCVGSNPSFTGGKSVSPPQYMRSAWRSLPIRTEDDAAGIVSVGRHIMGEDILDSLGANGQSRLKAFMKVVSNLTSRDMQKVANRHQNSLVANSIMGTNKESEKLFSSLGPENLKISHPDVSQSIANIFTGTDDIGNLSGQNVQHASIMNLIVRGIASTGTIEIPGADYHNGTNATGWNVDRNCGLAVARFFRMCYAQGVNGYAKIITDGGVRGDAAGATDPDNGLVVWRGDRGTASGMIMLRYVHGVERVDGEETSNFINGKRQIGFYNPNGGGASIGSSPFVNSPESLTLLATANYVATMIADADPNKVRQTAGDIMRERFGASAWPPHFDQYIRFTGSVFS